MEENFRINVLKNVVTIIFPIEDTNTQVERIELSELPSLRVKELKKLGFTSSSDVIYAESGYRKPYVYNYKEISSISGVKKYLNDLVKLKEEMELLIIKGFEIENKKEFLKMIRDAKKKLNILENEQKRTSLEIKAKRVLRKMNDDELEAFIEKYSN